MSYGVPGAGVDKVARLAVVLNHFNDVIDHGAAVDNLRNGIVDYYNDETGIDTGASVNATYSGSNDSYSATPGSETVYNSGSGNYTVPAGVESITVKMWGAGGTAARPSGGYFGAGAGGGGFSKFSEAVTPGENIAYSVGASNSSSGGDGGDTTFGAHTAEGGGGSTTSPGAGGIGETENGEAGLWDTTANANSRSGGDAGGLADGGGAGGGNGGGNPASGSSGSAPGGGGGGGCSGSSGGLGGAGRISITPNNSMTLVSEQFVADTAPATASLVLLVEEIATDAINELVVEVSSDDGVTWDEITMTNEGDFSSGVSVLYGQAGVTGNGTNMRYRVAATSAGVVKLHGAALQWD